MNHDYRVGYSRLCHAAAVLPLLLTGCGSSSSTAQSSNGQITDPWRDSCVATFTRDAAIETSYGDTVFTARAGEQYLLTSYETRSDGAHAEIAFLTAAGPYDGVVPMTSGQPFTSNCAIDKGVQYYAAFTDVSVYSTNDLATKICEIPAGTSMPRDMNANAGSSIAGALKLSGPTTYDVMLNAFSSLCGGATDGFVSVPETEVLGTTTWLVPIEVILKPS
jgi:hypothetical protein